MKSRNFLLQKTKGLFLTSINQIREVLNYDTKNTLSYFPLDYFTKINVKVKKTKNIKIGYLFKYYNDNVKNPNKLLKFIEKLPNNYDLYIFAPKDSIIKYKKLLSKIKKNNIIYNIGIDYNLLQEIDIILITSYCEGSPLPLYEGIFSKKYILSTNVGNCESFIPSFYLTDPNEESVDKLLDNLNLIKDNKFYNIDQIKSNYTLQNVNHSELVGEYYNFINSDIQFLLLDSKHRKSNIFCNFLIKKGYKCEKLSIAQSNDIDFLSNYLQKKRVHYFIIWNGMFDSQKITINNLKKIYPQSTLFKRLIILENGLFNQKNTFRFIRIDNNSKLELCNQISTLNSFKFRKTLYDSNKYYYKFENNKFPYKNITLICLQLATDTNFKYSSDFKDNNEFIDLILKIYSKNTDEKLIFKIHPLDKDFELLKNKYKNLVFINREYSLEEVIKKSKRVLTINSTCHYDTLINNKPLITFGKGLFSHKNVSLEANKNTKLEDIYKYNANKSAINYYLNNLNSLCYDLNDLENEWKFIKFNILNFWYNI